MIKLNGKEIKYSLFPNNELKIEPLRYLDNEENKTLQLELIYESSIDIVMLQLIKKYLDDKYSDFCVELLMKYIPYERMDRETKDQMFTCKYFAQIINDLCFIKVTVLDPHSNVSSGVLESLTELNVSDYVWKVMELEKIDAIFLPDVGAYKKYTELLDNIKIPKFWGNKHRDLESGRITSYDIIGDINVKDKNILIVDDLCVKGFTTLFAAKKLKELGADKVFFYCSHCEDNIHSGDLIKTDYVDKIYTTNSLKFDENKKIVKLY